MLFVPRDAVLAGSHGQLTDGGLFGKVELASFAAYTGGITQDLLRLLFKSEVRALAFVFLSTLVGQKLLKSTSVGTSIPSMRLDLLKRLPFPQLDQAEVEAINRHLSVAEEARIEASAAEAMAIGIVETEVLPAWLG
jgi:restriction endonuclease S subunit